MTEVVDLVFSLRGGALAPGYAVPLWQALRTHLPWLADEADAAILPLARLAHTPTALFLGRHSRLELRLPLRRAADARTLCGLSLNLHAADGRPASIAIGPASMRTLRPAAALYSPCVSLGCAAEADFLAEARRLLAQRDIDCQLVCGKVQTLLDGGRADAGVSLQGFSLMLHGLSPAHSLGIQRSGLGAGRMLGWGIFVPHKSVLAVMADAAA